MRPQLPEGVTLIHCDNKVAIIGEGEKPVELVTGEVPFPYPSAPAVCPKYLAAVEAQKKKRETSGRLRLVN